MEKYKNMSYDELKSHIKEIQVNVDKQINDLYNNNNMSFDEFNDTFEAITKDINDAKLILRLKIPLDQIEMTEHNFGDLMTIEEFGEDCKEGWLIDYDGHGSYATNDKVSDVSIYPSEFLSGNYRKDFTHIVWYNR